MKDLVITINSKYNFICKGFRQFKLLHLKQTLFLKRNLEIIPFFFFTIQKKIFNYLIKINFKIFIIIIINHYLNLNLIILQCFC